MSCFIRSLGSLGACVKYTHRPTYTRMDAEMVIFLLCFCGRSRNLNGPDRAQTGPRRGSGPDDWGAKKSRFILSSGSSDFFLRSQRTSHRSIDVHASWLIWRGPVLVKSWLQLQQNLKVETYNLKPNSLDLQWRVWSLFADVANRILAVKLKILSLTAVIIPAYVHVWITVLAKLFTELIFTK